jgi:tetratricopeptide (TPR) repeat protein
MRSLERLVEVEDRFEVENNLMAAGHFSLGQMYLRQGDVARAEEQFRHGHEAALRRMRENPGDAQAQRELAVSFGNLADLNLLKGNPAAARTGYEQAVAALDRLDADSEPALARMLTQLGILCLDLRDFNYAEKCLGEAYQLRKDAAAKHLDDSQLARELWKTTLYRGDAKFAGADLSGALEDYQEAIRLAEAIEETKSLGYLATDDCATSYERLATTLLGQFDVEGAKRFYEKALKLRELLAAQNPDNAEQQRALAAMHDRLGSMWLGLQNADLAHERFKASMDIRQKLAAARPDYDVVQIELLSNYGYLARAEEGRSNFDEAIRWYDKGLDLWTALTDDGQF